MLLFTRPAEPPSFATRAHSFRLELDGLREKMDFKKKEIWQEFKNYFFGAQHGKCGYCEAFITTDPGAVEHYRPKGMVQELLDDPTTWGRELENSTKVRGRQPKKLSDSGYWWLAYEWSNYLFACEVCNSSWKRNIFPVAEKPRPTIGKDQKETPLLLNPFGPENPVKHLSFDSIGQIFARDGSQYGYDTIRTCGLDRASLLRPRLEKARNAHFLVTELISAAEGQRFDEALADFHRMGQAETVHAGMVRSIFEEKTEVSWQELEERMSRIKKQEL